MINMIKKFTVFAFFVYAQSSLAQIYTWVDKAGTVHYSDTPQRHAKAIPINIRESTSAPILNTSASKTVLHSVAQASHVVDYDTILFEQPHDRATIQNTGGDVEIKIKVLLRSGDSWRVLLDGKETGARQTAQRFILSGVERGEHTLQVQAIDSNNNVLASSAILTIYVHQGIITAP
jgi:hypothetical protein